MLLAGFALGSTNQRGNGKFSLLCTLQDALSILCTVTTCIPLIKLSISHLSEKQNKDCHFSL